MCYMINFIAYKDISKDEMREYSKYRIGITDNTSRMMDPEPNRFYYTITGWRGCACEFYRGDPGNGNMLVDLLKESIQLGEIILFFYWDEGDYEEVEYHVHDYINKTKQIIISLDDFLHTFLTKQFEAEDVVYVINA